MKTEKENLASAKIYLDEHHVHVEMFGCRENLCILWSAFTAQLCETIQIPPKTLADALPKAVQRVTEYAQSKGEEQV